MTEVTTACDLEHRVMGRVCPIPLAQGLEAFSSGGIGRKMNEPSPGLLAVSCGHNQ